MKKNLFKYLILLWTIILYNSCTVYDNPAPYFEDSEEEVTPPQRKILFISIDGLVGRELEKSIPKNLQALIDKGKFTFNSISDEKSNPVSTWTTMMTGVNSSIHHVEDETFTAKADASDQHAEIAFAPTFFYRFFATRPEYNTTIVSSWEPLVSKLLVEAETQVITNSDEITRDSAVFQLANEDPEVMVVQFRDVFFAGQGKGFTVENQEYANAIEKVDGYIGEIMKALSARENYDKEEWIVMVTSNQGGSPDGTSGSDAFQDRNTFTILHYKNFTKQEIKPALIGSTNFSQYAGVSDDYIANVAEAADGNEYNFNSSEMSVEFKFKKNQHINHTSQAFVIGKTSRENHGGSGKGWGIATANNKLIFYITFDDDVKYEYNFGADINDFKWHHIAFSLKKTAEKTVQLTLFNDGTTANTATITTTGSVNGTFTTSAPLFIGVRKGHNGSALAKDDLQFADLRIYNKAIDNRDASRLACYINEINNDDPLFAAQIGSYKLDNVINNSFENDIADKPILRFTTNSISKSDVSLISTKCNADDLNNILITSQDYVTMIFYWLRITPEPGWNLKGAKVLNTFESEFINVKK